MESILPIQDEVCPYKSRRKKSATYLSNSTNVKINHPINTNILSLICHYIKTMIAQRTLYILGVLNLILATVAIVCVTQAEDHPEYFSLVYISIGIFIFYMATILFIIILQILETYQEQNQRTRSSLSTQIPLLTSQILNQSNPIIVESMTTITKPKTRLSRSQTLPSSSLNPHHVLSPSTSSSTLKDPIKSPRLILLPKYHRSLINKTPKNYQSFALTTNDPFCPSCTTINNSDSTSQLSSLIKPIPVKYYVNSENRKCKKKFSQY